MTVLTLRSVCAADAPDLQDMHSTGVIAKTTATIPLVYKRADIDRWIESACVCRDDRREWAIALGAKKAIIGIISCARVSDTGGNVAYWVGERFWGNGYATLAVSLVLRETFVQERFLQVQGRHLDSNPASGRVLQKNGFRFVGTQEVIWRKSEQRTLCKYLRDVPHLPLDSQ